METNLNFFDFLSERLKKFDGEICTFYIDFGSDTFSLEPTIKSKSKSKSKPQNPQWMILGWIRENDGLKLLSDKQITEAASLKNYGVVRNIFDKNKGSFSLIKAGINNTLFLSTEAEIYFETTAKLAKL